MKINDKRTNDTGPRQGDFIAIGQCLFLVVNGGKIVSLPEGVIQSSPIPEKANIVDVEMNILRNGR